MFEGYLELGGGEVLNSARALGYTRTAPCPVAWLQCPPCDGIRDVLDDDAYTYANIMQAPWFDAEDETTHRFLGAHALTIEGIPDSTREANVAEGIQDGGVVGRVRLATRRMRVRAVLSAIGEDALEAGFSWLNSALTPGKCATHADACGASDTRFFTACPPERGDFLTDTVVWNDPVTNLATNPSFETAGGTSVLATNRATNPSFEALSGAAVEVRRNLYTNPGPGHPWPNVKGTATPLADGTQFDIDTQVGTGDWVALSGQTLAGTIGQPFIAEMEVEVPVGYPAISLFWQHEMSPAHLNGTPVTINPGEKKRVGLDPGMVWGENAVHRLALRVGTFNVPNGARFIVRKMMAEYASVARPYFDGSTLNAGDWTYAWTGATNNSQSIQMGLPVAGVQAINGASVVTSQGWAGNRTRSLRVASNGYGDNDLARIPITGLQANTTYTALATLRLAAAHASSNSRSRSLWVSPSGGTAVSVQAPNVAGVYPLSVTFTTGPAGTTADVDLMTGGSAGDEVWWDNLMVVEGGYAGPYFDGATPDGDNTFDWTGTPDASASTMSGTSVAGVTTPAGQASVSQTADSPALGTKALRFTLETTGAIALGVTDVLPITGTTYTLIGKVRPRTRDQQFTPRIRAATGAPFTAPKDVWTDFRVTAVAGAGTNTQTGLLIAAASGHQIDDVVDFDAVALIEGDYAGPYFDGDGEDTATADYEWAGTPHASASTYATGNIVQVEDPVAFEQAVNRLIRVMHTVTCVSGPIVEQKLHRGDTWGYIVEFVLVAAVPWMFGVTVPVALLPTTPIVVQDVPFNLVPYPSAELAAGTVVAATNFSTNPSVEVDASGWTAGGDHTSGSGPITGTRSTALAAAGGVASFLTHFTPTVSGGHAQANIYADHSIPIAVPAGTRVSFTMWATAAVVSGTATLDNIVISAIWWDAANTLLRVDALGSMPPAGGAITVKSTLPPAGATRVTMRAGASLPAWSAGAVVDLYSDAVSVSVP